MTYEEALKHVSNPDDFALRFRGIASTSDGTWDDFEGANEGQEKAEAAGRRGPLRRRRSPTTDFIQRSEPGAARRRPA